MDEKSQTVDSEMTTAKKACSKFKRRSFTLAEKVTIIRQIESGQSQVNVGRTYGIHKATVSTMWKNKDEIIRAFEDSNPKCKKRRRPARENIDEALLKWYQVQRCNNIPTSGRLLKLKAEELGKLFGESDFVCSEGWMDRFKTRHNISFSKMSGEGGSLLDETVKEWLAQWPQMRGAYSDDDIFNADETGLFYRMLPDKTVEFKGERCINGELSEERLTVLVCANMSGNQKRRLLVIGKSQNPKCFMKVKNLPVCWKSNKCAWMTSELFEEELQEWDRELQLQERRILLVLDHCNAHPRLDHLENIKLVFFPAGTPSEMQPMGKGVIHSLKCHFKKLLILQLIQAIDKKVEFSMNVLDAVRMLNKAWERVSGTTIARAFHYAGLQSSEVNEDVEENEDDLSLADWARWHSIKEFEGVSDLDAFEIMDQDLITTEVPTESDIVMEVKKTQQDLGLLKSEDTDEEDTADFEDDSLPTVGEALQAMKIISQFFEYQDAADEVKERASKLERDMEEVYLARRRWQKEMTEYFVTQ